jgi:hypothetical protein
MSQRTIPQSKTVANKYSWGLSNTNGRPVWAVLERAADGEIKEIATFATSGQAETTADYLNSKEKCRSEET